MSGHVRFGFAACLVVAGCTAPAAANPFTDLFSSAPAPEAASPAPAPASEECRRQPGPATAGGHWVYRYDGGRKCWFQAEAGAAVAKRPSRSRLARRRAAPPEESEPAPPRPKAVENARAELVTPAPAATPEPAPPAPKLTVVRTVPVHLADAAAQVPPAPPVGGADQAAPASPAPVPVDVEKLLAEAPAASEEVAPVAAAAPIAAPAATTAGGDAGIPSWPGVLLMVLGGAALFASSPALRRAVWPRRIADAGTELSAAAQAGRSDPSFAAPRIRIARVRRDEVFEREGDSSRSHRALDFEAQSAAPLEYAAPPRRTVAPPPPSKEALWEEGIGALAALASPISPEVVSKGRAMGYGGVERGGGSSG